MVGYLRGVAPEIMARALATFPGVPGRMERIEAGQPYMVVVDYAHTADSLEKALSVLRPLTAGRLIVVFGSAGER
jgi:UDP-N-acetylmuramoyl-L-alanyl-D-glutamate--2,6-diaminopimelate ligase